MTRWVALLRGVNVGGANRLPMAELRSTMAQLGFESVATYIQSGNVAFDASDELGEAILVDTIRSAIDERHGLTTPVVVRTAHELDLIVAAHRSVDNELDPKLVHVLFLDRPPAASVVGPLDPASFQPDSWTIDGRQISVRYPHGSARSKLTIEVFERAWAVTATARNLNTVRKLADLAART